MDMLYMMKLVLHSNLGMQEQKLLVKEDILVIVEEDIL